MKTAVVLFALFCALPSYGEEVPRKPTYAPSGLLSQTKNTGGGGSANLEMPWGSEGVSQESNAPITGSVYRNSPTEWESKVFNNSSDATFSASIKVTQQNPSGGSVKSDFFSVTLKPGESHVQQFRSANNTANAQLDLLSWREVSKKMQPTPKAVATRN